jgi:hypothetical protein
MNLVATESATSSEQETGVEKLRERIAALVARRQQLRRLGASRASLEQNRLQLARSQSELCQAFIELHVPPLLRGCAAPQHGCLESAGLSDGAD